MRCVIRLIGSLRATRGPRHRAWRGPQRRRPLCAPFRAYLCTHLLVFCCVAGVSACADFAGTVDPTFGLPDVVPDAPTLSRDVQPILDKRCAFGGCHSVASQQAGLVLVRGVAHAALVRRPSRLVPTDTLVVPGDPARSWLVVMIAGDSVRRGGLSRMPLAATPLTPNQIATIARWINQGAPDD